MQVNTTIISGKYFFWEEYHLPTFLSYFIIEVVPSLILYSLGGIFDTVPYTIDVEGFV